MGAMRITTSGDVLALLRQLPLLDAEQMDEVSVVLQLRFPDALTLTAELRRRGWLSAFQVEQILQGRGPNLQLGPYVLLDRLGQGGMGEVFKARHEVMDRVVALKVIRKDRLVEPGSEQRFLREIRAAAQLSHPNIVIAHDAGQIDGTHFYTMEYIEGIDLAHLIAQKGPLPIHEACDYIRQASLGLQHAFERGMVHRDIKPSNLLVTDQPDLMGIGKKTVKILDMGLARLNQEAERTALTATGAVVGTPDFLAPEQVANSRTVDIRADLYSLGCTFYFLLAGHAPFPEGTPIEKLFKHTEEYPRPIEELRPGIPERVAVVVRKLMAKHPDDRYQTPDQVAALVQPYCREPKKAPAPIAPATAPVIRSPRTERPMSWSTAVGIVLVLAIGIGVGLAFWRPWNSGPPPRATNSLGMEFTLIKPGTFQMGSPADEKHRGKDEGPQHPVLITQPFYLGTHEVTVGNFREFVQAKNYKTDAEKSGEGASRPGPAGRITDPDLSWKNPGWGKPADDEPVVCVSHRDAQEFCKWLSEKEGRTYRLPTEAEWEYACRAGTSTPFSVGETLDPKDACFRSPAKTPTMPDRITPGYSPNAFGLHDMHGNVAEWCADLYDGDYYRSSPKPDPTGPSRGGPGVVRGGSWCSDSSACRSAARSRWKVDGARNDVGFRVVLVPKGGGR